jgi:hypothetical protein
MRYRDEQPVAAAEAHPMPEDILLSEQLTALTEADRRFFIVSPGRTGSTLLSTILADAGADFGKVPPPRWDRAGGDMEHPYFLRAARYFLDAEAISLERPAFGIARMRWVIYRSMGKRWLRAGLEQARFAKVYGANSLVRPAFKMAYFPTVILSYRRFEDYAASLGLIHAHATSRSLHERYRQTYADGLWLLSMFGGCVVDYESLVDIADCSWAEPLALTTGLSTASLVKSRSLRLENASSPVEPTRINQATDTITSAILAMRSKPVPPSCQALRSWNSVRRRSPERAAPERARPGGRGACGLFWGCSPLLSYAAG